MNIFSGSVEESKSKPSTPSRTKSLNNQRDCLRSTATTGQPSGTHTSTTQKPMKRKRTRKKKEKQELKQAPTSRAREAVPNPLPKKRRKKGRGVTKKAGAHFCKMQRHYHRPKKKKKRGVFLTKPETNRICIAKTKKKGFSVVMEQ
jgi:hypothetical protein